MRIENERKGALARVWDRPQNGRNGPVAGVVISALALFGAAMIGLALAEGSMAAAGARIDGLVEGARTLVP